MLNLRRKTKVVMKGNVAVGGNNPISVQSMTNTKTIDVVSTVAQINALQAQGCEIIRVAVPDMDAAYALSKIKKDINIPLVADIHFNYKLALIAIDQGVDCIRINPGNIDDKQKITEIVERAKDQNVSIRIGLNSGSVKRSNQSDVASDMVVAALNHINLFEQLNFKDIIISLKASNVLETIRAYEKMADFCDYPFHLGITSAGTLRSGTVKSSIGLGLLLSYGIGDTIRVSLSYDPIEEVRVAYEILSVFGLRERKKPELISCPTCGRCKTDLINIINKVEERIDKLDPNLKIAVMGCMVNGPGEAQDVDYGVAWGDSNCALLFKKGLKDKKLEGTVEDIIEEFIENICTIEQEDEKYE